MRGKELMHCVPGSCTFPMLLFAFFSSQSAVSQPPPFSLPQSQEAIRKVVQQVRSTGLPSSHTLQTFFERVAADTLPCQPHEAVTALLAQQKEECEQEGDEGEDRDDEQQPDPYLCLPQIEEAVCGHLIFVEVPALPRGCV